MFTTGSFKEVQLGPSQQLVMTYGIVPKVDIHQDEKQTYRFHLRREAFPGTPGNANSTI